MSLSANADQLRTGRLGSKERPASFHHGQRKRRISEVMSDHSLSSLLRDHSLTLCIILRYMYIISELNSIAGTLFRSMTFIHEVCLVHFESSLCTSPITNTKKEFERDGVQDFSDEVWLQKIFEGSSKKRIEYWKNKDFLRAIQGYSGRFPIEPELMRKTTPFKQSFEY